MNISIHPVSDLTAAQKKSKRQIQKFFTGFLKKQAKILASQIAKPYQQTTKADDDTAQKIVDTLVLDWEIIAEEVREDLGGSFEDTAQIVLGKLEIDDQSIFDLVNERSVEFADEMAADLVTGVTEATRERLRELVAEAIESAQGVNELKASILDDYMFSADRAEVIARTEIGNAHMAGALEGAKASGLNLVKSIVRGSEEYDCDICGENEESGKIPLDEEFPSGDEGPLFHPNCECTLIFSPASK